MSDVLDRPRAARSRPAARAGTGNSVASIWIRGAFAASWVFVVGLAALVVLALVVWAADSRSQATAGDATRLAAQLWLLAHRTPLRATGGPLTIPPMCLTALFGYLLARASAIVARSAECADARDVSIVVAAIAGPYAVFAAILAASTSSSTFRPSVGAAFVCAALVSSLAASIGAIHGSGLSASFTGLISADLRAAVDAAGRAALVILSAATLLVAGSLVAHSGELGSILRHYHGGPAEFTMLLLSVLLLPNAVCFAAAYLIGPGFAIGTGTSVHYAGAHLGAVPSFPLLAAVPSGPAPWYALSLGLVTLVLAGGAAGWRIAKLPQRTLGQRLRISATAAAALGVGAALLVAFAGGPAGPGRLAAVGPSPWKVGFSVTAEVAVVAALVVLVATWMRSTASE